MEFVAIYMRLSRDSTQNGIEESLENHRLALTRICKTNGWKYDIYEEIASGVSPEREQLNLLLSRLNDYTAILTMDVDRIGRDPEHNEKVLKMLILNGIKIITPSGEYDFANENSQMLYRMQSMLSSFEYSAIRKRLGRGKFLEASKGHWVMNNIPLGYLKNPETKRLEIDENEAEIVRYIFEKTIEGYSVNKISQDLDAFGWRSKKGKVLSTAHISQMRRNPLYYGVVRYERKNELGRVLENCWVEDAHSGIVTKEEFLRCQELIKNNNNKKFKTHGKVKHILQGLIYCAKCGRKRYICVDRKDVPYIKADGAKIENVRCSDAGMALKPVTDAVIEDVKKLKSELEEEIIKLKKRNITKSEKEISNKLIETEANKDKLNKKKKNLVEMRMNGEITKDEFLQFKDGLEEQIRHTDDMIQLLQMKLNNLSNTEDEVKKLEKVIWTIDNLDNLSVEKINSFLRSIIKKVLFSRNIESNPNTTKRDDVEPTVDIEWIEGIPIL
ncbi:resolvase [Bacillus wiedmannii]|uniref:recombinase family protein n=1 Tax=Bacillus wiedmannii TaxID=1890302 RepID=UPI000BF74AE7|nr:recombinase family protein [Bacillus wiedmannii]PGE55221.1 resolvase [Bacillus wiedmannii]HDR7914772.1 recombinase family protein [Bacillus wiedmannii]